jgi:ubiquinone/menaquinone biosynthesis C-methylase UbiE
MMNEKKISGAQANSSSDAHASEWRVDEGNSSTRAKSLSQERFGKYAQGYVKSQTHAKGYDLERLLELAQPQPDWIVLDIATGGGHTALTFAPHVKKVIATDITPKMLEAARQHITGQGITNVDFEPADAENLPFEDIAFDLVTCRIAPHHFPNCARFVRQAARVLKNGGLFLMQDQVLSEDAATAQYMDDFERARDPSHHKAYGQSQWMAMFESAGLVVEHNEQITKRHNLIRWVETQGHRPELVEELRLRLIDAPPKSAAWLQALAVDSPEASFVNHHLLIAGRKK